MSTRAIAPDTLRFTVILGMLAALPSLSIDISAPSLLVVQAQLGAPGGLVGLTITLFMLGFAFGQFGAGPLSDSYGRRPVLLVALTGYTAAAAFCATAGSIEALVAWRFVQGIAAGACAVLAFAMIRDLFEGEVARSKRSYVSVVFGLAPMLAPSLGAWVLGRAGWRPIYVILGFGGLTLLATVLLGISESRRTRPVQTPPIHSSYRKVLSNRAFVGIAFVNALSFGGMFAYIAGSSLVLMGQYGVSGQVYGIIFAATAAALTLGAWTSGQTATRGINAHRVMLVGLATAAASAVLLMVLIAARVGMLSAVIPLLVLNLFCRGLVAPNAQHLALEPMRDQAGTATAAVGVLQILIGAVSSGLVTAAVPVFGALGMSAVMSLLAIVSLVLWVWLTAPPRTRCPAQPHATAAMPEPGV